MAAALALEMALALVLALEAVLALEEVVALQPSEWAVCDLSVDFLFFERGASGVLGTAWTCVFEWYSINFADECSVNHTLAKSP